jgi:hypothetical protein
MGIVTRASANQRKKVVRVPPILVARKRTAPLALKRTTPARKRGTSPTRKEIYNFKKWGIKKIWDRVSKGKATTTLAYHVQIKPSVSSSEMPQKLFFHSLNVSPVGSSYVTTRKSGDDSILGPKYPQDLVVCLMDVNRVGDYTDDNHDAELHSNLLWFHRPSQTVHRFDPYYSFNLEDTYKMQQAIDRIVVKHWVPKGWTFERFQDWAGEVPFGPQMVDLTHTDRRSNEHFCTPWCLAVASALLELQNKQTQPVSTAQAVRHMLRKLKLPLMSSEDDNLLPERYYRGIKALIGVE